MHINTKIGREREKKKYYFEHLHVSLSVCVFVCMSVFLKLFEFMQRFLYCTENGTQYSHGTTKNSTNKIATTTEIKTYNENERKITHSDGQMLDI